MDFTRAHVIEFSAALLVFLWLLFVPVTIYSVIGASLFTYFSLRFFNSLGEYVEIRDLMIVIALLQWIIGPVLTYLFFQDDEFYRMVVSEEEYMSYVFPAAIAFTIGLYIPIWKKNIDENTLLDNIKKKMVKHPNIDIYLIGIGTAAALIKDHVPLALRFFMFLLANLRFVGLYFLLLNRRQFKWVIFGAMIGWLFLTAVSHGMFHNLLLWLGFMLVILALIYKFKFSQKLLLFGLLFALVLIIQAVKHEYRNIVREQNMQTLADKSETFSNLAQSRIMEPGVLFNKKYMNANVNRINQGWIIARIMRYTPRYEPYARGETIKAGLKSLLPRLIAPGKIKAGGHRYFQRFTGKRLQSDTSMNLSILGEAYANYGKSGGTLFMLFLGMFFNFFLQKIYSLAQTYPSLIFWLPLIFLQVVKAETDFATVINHLIKASVIVFLVIWGSKKFFNLDM